MEGGGRIPLADLAADYAEAGPAIEAAVLRVLRSGQYVLGPETRAFEAELAELVGVRFAVGVGSGTEALALALRAVGVGPGDDVVTTPFTFFATVGAILQLGARPVFADVEAGGFHVDPEALEAALTPRTRAVVPVHLFGRCADMRRIAAGAAARGVPIVEDAAQAIGASRGGRRAGAWGRAGCFSFYPSKPLGAAGDAGGITSDDPELAARLRLLRNHGSERDGLHVLAGTTSRLDALQAAVLRAKLPFLKGWTEGRLRNASIYAEELAGCPELRLPRPAADEEPVWSHYAIRCSRPEPVRAALSAAGIGWRHYYPLPAYRQPALGTGRLPEGSCPEAERACAEAIALPVRASCAPSQIRRIARVIRDALAG